MTSIKDIARLAGVSPSTVSRVLNEREYVREEVRQRVLDIVKEQGYVQNHVARSMVLQRSFTIGVVIPYLFNMFQRQLFASMEFFLEQHGYKTQFFFLRWSEASEQAFLRRLKSETLDGIIFIHELDNPIIYQYIQERELPVALCTFEKSEFGFPAVHVEEEASASLAVNYLLQKGHRNIALITGEHFSFGRQREAGYKKALAAHGLQVNPELIIRAASYNPEAGRASMLTLIKRKQPMSAVFAVTDELAIGAMKALYEAGLRVPEDVSVIGLDDIDISAFTTPGLTTVRQPIFEMGKKSADLVCDWIAHGRAQGSAELFSTTIVERESVQARVKE
ncbi:Transcriptional regulator [uncultured spirochete]|jgi:LacI family transcriptional regulator|uniref:Transcriptional regulator n=1 Tax=uncultured spirochete TaxID=156406 RepID=A0A3P3XK81_9SPIR|nr:LacI family DNA-binding transcriptional regulator [Rectinema subterraneum]SLM13752.1 Transcriptional regulator [uncultured spirochete]